MVSAGVNLVEHRSNSVLHAEIVAIMFAQRAVDAWTLVCGARGIDIVRDVRRVEAQAVLAEYQARGGTIYNPSAAPPATHSSRQPRTAASRSRGGLGLATNRSPRSSTTSGPNASIP